MIAPAEGPDQQKAAEKLLAKVNTSLQVSNSKLHAVNVARSAIVRDRGLKGREDAYWRAVVAMEGDADDTGGVTSVWEEEEVVRAMTKVMGRGGGRGGNGGVDVGKLSKDADDYVSGILGGLVDSRGE